MPSFSSTAHLQISLASHQHIHAIAYLERTCYAGDGYSEGFLYQALAQWPQSLWVATHGSELLGYALIAPGSQADEYWLMAVVVASQGRGQGIGKKLCQACIRHARARGIESLYLTVAENNHIALHLYRQLGFTKIALKQDFFGAGQHRLLMHLAL